MRHGANDGACGSTRSSPAPASPRAAGRRADQGRPRHVNGARRAQHVVGGHDRSRSTASRSRARSSPTSSCTSPPASSRPRATRRAGPPSSTSSTTRSRVVPVGRLDADTTGALLLTNDGQLAHRLAHPRYGVEKVYEAEVEGDPAEEALRRLARGRRARGRPHRAGEARSRLARGPRRAVLHEGRKHQVKRMCEAVGHPGAQLHRRGYAGLDLDGLAPGQWRELRATRSRPSAPPRRRPSAACVDTLRAHAGQ